MAARMIAIHNKSETSRVMSRYLNRVVMAGSLASTAGILGPCSRSVALNSLLKLALSQRFFSFQDVLAKSGTAVFANRSTALERPVENLIDNRIRFQASEDTAP
jgi:hypothetical protein